MVSLALGNVAFLAVILAHWQSELEEVVGVSYLHLEVELFSSMAVHIVPVCEVHYGILDFHIAGKAVEEFVIMI